LKSCIFILADGARADVFEELLKRGDLPNISKYIIEKGAFTNAVSVFPSTTGPAYAPFLIGRFPGRCNLPGIRWFDRKLYAKEFFSLYRFRSYVGPESFLMNRDISKDAQTLFEIFPRTINIVNELSRGAGLKGDKTRFLRAYYKIKGHFNNRWDEIDIASRRILLDSLRNCPQFAYVVFLGIDTYSHLTHPFHHKVIDSYLRIDESVGILGKTLEDMGRLDETLLVITSDHGLTPTHSHFDSVEFMNRLGFKTFYYPKIFKHYRNADAANMISGNAMTHLYVKSPEGWERRSTFEELTGLVSSLLERPEVDIVAGLDERRRVRIKSERGEALTWLDESGCIRYENVYGDPFGYNGLPEKMDRDEALRYSFYTKYPDALLQTLQILQSPRSGDLVVSANQGFDLRAKHENPEHCSSHGALFREQILVPLGINVKIKKEFVRTVDLYPTILRLLGKPIPKDIDGVSLVN
jgi:type I phosphodiesterase/nucleotide pyrophosphatase